MSLKKALEQANHDPSDDLSVEGLKKTMQILLKHHSKKLATGDEGLARCNPLFRPFIANIGKDNLPTDKNLRPSVPPTLKKPSAVGKSNVLLAAAFALATNTVEVNEPKCNHCREKADQDVPCATWLNPTDGGVRFSGTCLNCLVYRNGKQEEMGASCSLYRVEDDDDGHTVDQGKRSAKRRKKKHDRGEGEDDGHIIDQGKRSAKRRKEKPVIIKREDDDDNNTVVKREDNDEDEQPESWLCAEEEV